MNKKWSPEQLQEFKEALKTMQEQQPLFEQLCREEIGLPLTYSVIPMEWGTLRIEKVGGFTYGDLARIGGQVGELCDTFNYRSWGHHLFHGALYFTIKPIFKIHH